MKVRVNKSSDGGLPLLTGTGMRRMWMVVAASSVVFSATTTFNAGCAFNVLAFATDRSAVLSHRPQTLIRRSTELSAASDDDIIVGAPSDKAFTPKLVDCAKFNLFGIGKQYDEDKNGVFQLPPNSMNGKIVLITGASAGLGLESAKRLALAGATVILTARTQEKVIASVNAVREYCKGGTPVYGKTGRPVIGAYINPNPDVRGIDLDLDDLASVRSFPERYLCCMQDARIDVDISIVMNNAGGSKPSRVLTVDGYSSTFQSCHLGHFLLTARLLEESLLNRDTSGSNNGCTVINLTSCSYRSAIANHGKYEDESDIDYGFDFNNVNGEIEYEGFGAYFSAKLANVLFTKELQRRAEEHKQSWLKAVSIEPGGVASDIWRYDFYDPRTVRERCDNGEELIQPKGSTSLVAQIWYRLLCTEVERGANSQIWLALKSGVKSGDDENAIIRGGQHFNENRNPIPVTAFADNEDAAGKLWELSEEMCGVRFDLSAL